ncbi:MAG: GNAT family N-acetyltransferase [Clostridia bacterium]|nr:GNAT family N-acetyltransferase [Clostridia bacterium]
MRPVSDPAMCRDLIGEARKRVGTVRSNCFAMAASFDPFIEEGRLYYEESPEGLCLFTDEGRYFQLYYFLNPASDFPRIRAEKPVLIEETNARGARDEEIARAAGWYGARGFQFFKRNGYYTCTLKPGETERPCGTERIPVRREKDDDSGRPADESAEPPSENRRAESETAHSEEGWTLREVRDPETAEQVITLWEASLDPTDIPLAHRRFIRSGTDRALCAADGTRVLGAVWYRLGRNTCEERHLAVHPDARRRGLGTLLLRGVMNAAAAAGKTLVNTWISDTNAASIALHTRAGFREQPRNCIQYILKET